MDLYLVSTVDVTIDAAGLPAIDDLLAYIRSRCDEVTLAGLAHHFSCHPNTVASLLKQGTGKTFTQHVRQARLQRASDLLEQTGLSVEEVARTCGYENPGTLYRLFREERGTTPRGQKGQGSPVPPAPGVQFHGLIAPCGSGTVER